MFSGKNLSYPILIFLSFILSGCERQSDSDIVTALKQQLQGQQKKLEQLEKQQQQVQQAQQKKLEQLEKQQLALAGTDQLIAKAISNLNTRQQAMTYTELDPSQTRFFILNNSSIALAGRILSVVPTTDGSVIHISLVNLLSIPVANIGFQMTWGNEKPKNQKELAHWQQLLFSTQLNSDIELLPGQWKDIDLTLKGVSPNNFKYLKMSLNMDNIAFGNNQPPKVEAKKNKK